MTFLLKILIGCNRISISVLFFCLAAASAFGQEVIGTTTIYIDPDTGIGAADCRTDLDGTAQSFYGAIAICEVRDQNGTLVGSDQFIDYTGGLGFADAGVFFTAIPGNTYTATGRPEAEFILAPDYAEGSPAEFDDYYDFLGVSEGFSSPPTKTVTLGSALVQNRRLIHRPSSWGTSSYCDRSTDTHKPQVSRRNRSSHWHNEQFRLHTNNGLRNKSRYQVSGA